MAMWSRAGSCHSYLHLNSSLDFIRVGSIPTPGESLKCKQRKSSTYLPDGTVIGIGVLHVVETFVHEMLKCSLAQFHDLLVRVSDVRVCVMLETPLEQPGASRAFSLSNTVPDYQISLACDSIGYFLC